MYPVSDDYIKSIMGSTVTCGWRGTITSASGKQYTFTDADLTSGSTKVTREIVSKSDIELGSTCAAELSMGIYLDVDRYTLYGGTVDLFFKLKLNDTDWEEVPLGIFNITEPPERGVEIITLHAYDSMTKFDKSCGTQVTGMPYALLTTACTICGVELGTTQSEISAMPNGGVETYADESVEIKTWRDFIGYVAAFLGGYAVIGTDGKLYVKQFGLSSVRTIPASWRYSYTPCDYETHFTSLTHTLVGSNKEEYFSTGESGLDYDLGKNPFIQFPLDSTRQSILNNILNALAEAAYTPFECSVPCDPSLTVGDIIDFTGGQAVAGKVSIITRQTIAVNNAMSLSMKGTDPSTQVTTDTDKKISSAVQSANDDGMHYYDYVNAEDIHIGDGESARVIDFNYATGKETHVDFHAELKMAVDTVEEDDNPDSDTEGTWTEHDGRVKVTYYSNGVEVEEYYPAEWFWDGTHLLHLLWTLWASANMRGRFEVYLSCEGCAVDIKAGDCHAYIAGCSLAGDSAWDGTINFEDKVEPLDFSVVFGSFTSDVELRFPGIIQKALNDNVIALDFYDVVMGGFTGAVQEVSSLFRFDVPYTDSTVTKENITTSNNVWTVTDGSDYGSVTTTDCETTVIEKITSKHTGDDVSYVVSFDGGTTWWSYSNGWVEPDYTKDLYGMYENVLEGITSEQWAEKLTGTVMVRAVLASSASVTDIQIYTNTTKEA